MSNKLFVIKCTIIVCLSLLNQINHTTLVQFIVFALCIFSTATQYECVACYKLQINQPIKF